MKKYNFICLGLSIAAAICNPGLTKAQNTRFNNEYADTTKLTQILISESILETPGQVDRIAKLFIDTPYGAGTLDKYQEEALTVNLDSLDCTTFVETVLALAYTACEHRQSWQDFTYNLRRFRYRHGEIDGYASRLHYISEWILDNAARGNLREITADLPGVRYGVKSLDYMSTHRNKYPALSDDNTFAAIKNVEAGLSNHRYPYIKGSSVKNDKLASHLRNGDIICFTTAIKGLDVTHMAIITMIDGIPHLIHASRSSGKIILDPLSLSDYVRRNRNDGIRVLRLRID